MQPITSNNWVLLFTNHTLLSCTKKTISGTLQVIILITGWIKPTSFRTGLCSFGWSWYFYCLYLWYTVAAGTEKTERYKTLRLFFLVLQQTFQKYKKRKKKKAKIIPQQSTWNVFSLRSTYAFHSSHPCLFHASTSPSKNEANSSKSRIYRRLTFPAWNSWKCLWWH